MYGVQRSRSGFDPSIKNINLSNLCRFIYVFTFLLKSPQEYLQYGFITIALFVRRFLTCTRRLLKKRENVTRI